MVDTQNTHKKGVVAHTFNPSTWVIETDWSLWVWGHSGQQSEFKDSQTYVERLCQKKRKKKKETDKMIYDDKQKWQPL